jgi:hypothetical protein
MATSKIRAGVLQFQPRDLALLRGLFESRVMTTAHATALYFDNKIDAANKRLQKLKSCGFIGERPRRAFQPSVLFLTRNGIKQLEAEGILQNYPSFALPALDRRARVSDLTIRHELEVMDVKAAFHSAIKALPSRTIAEFSTWPLLNEFKAYRPGHKSTEVLVKPDGFILIHEAEADGTKFERTFFLEVDRSTETQDVLVDRAGCYFDYYKSGGFAMRNGATRADYKQFPFRVIMVFKSAERRNNTAERLLQGAQPIFKQVCHATLEDVTRDPFGAIWIRPFDYREATKGTQFIADRPRETWQYKRQAEREAFIEQHIQKHSILADE